MKAYSLFKKILVKVDIVLQKFNVLMDGIVQARPYKLQWSDILEQYEESKIDDYCEFATSFTFDYHERNGIQDNADSKLRMYNDLVEGLIARKA
jgi:hypothetical protein